MNQVATIGHNEPPASEAFAMSINDLYAEAKNYLDGEAIENQAQADSIGKIVADMKKLLKDAETTRKAEKQPYLDAGKAVDDRWKKVKEPAERAIATAEKPLTEWRVAVQAAKDAEAKALREEADRKAAEALAAHQNAKSLEDAEKAEELIQRAQIAEKTANKIERQPTGLTTYWEAEITDRRALLQHVMVTDPAWLTDRLQEYATTAVRATKADLPGVTAHERKRAR